MALDKDGDPVLIEGNTVYPGISLEQMCSGPIFGNRTDEVIDYLINTNRSESYVMVVCVSIWIKFKCSLFCRFFEHAHHKEECMEIYTA